MKAKTFDQQFDDGRDISKHLDLSRTKRPLREQKSVEVKLTDWMIDRLDQEARNRGVTRQEIIRLWLSERLGKAG